MVVSATWTPRVCKRMARNHSKYSQKAVALHAFGVQVAVMPQAPRTSGTVGRLRLQGFRLGDSKDHEPEGSTDPIYALLDSTLLFYTLYFTILYYTIRYCTVLYNTVLYCTLLYSTPYLLLMYRYTNGGGSEGACEHRSAPTQEASKDFLKVS